jgi:hypothetical protein
MNSNQGGRELITGETEREHIKVSISTKFRKVIQENRVGVSQDKKTTVWLTMLILIRVETCDLKMTSHKCSILLSRHEGSIFDMKDIWIDDKSQILYSKLSKALL